MITYGGRPCSLTRNVKKHTNSAPIPVAPTSFVLLLLSYAEAIPPSLYIHSTSINLKKTSPAFFLGRFDHKKWDTSPFHTRRKIDYDEKLFHENHDHDRNAKVIQINCSLF